MIYYGIHQMVATRNSIISERLKAPHDLVLCACPIQLYVADSSYVRLTEILLQHILLPASTISSIRSATFISSPSSKVGPNGHMYRAPGIHVLVHDLIIISSPTCHLRPYSNIDLPCRIHLQVIDALLPLLTLRKSEFLKCLFFITREHKEPGK